MHLFKGVYFLCLSLAMIIISSQDSLAVVGDDADSQKMAADYKIYTHSINHDSVKIIDGKIRGLPKGGRRAIDVEVMVEILKRMGLENKIVTMPFNRALKEARLNDNVIVFNVFKSEERERFLNWVGPTRSFKSYFYEKKDEPTNIKSLEDAKTVKGICVLRGNVHHERFVKLGFKNLVLVSHYPQCTKLMQNGTVTLFSSSTDATVFGDGSVPTGYRRTDVEIFEYQGHIGLSKAIPMEFVAKMKAALDGMKKDGTFATILKNYGNEQ